MNPRIDVAVVAHGRYDLTQSCLEHLESQSVPHTVTVCDNGSDPPFGERLAADFPAARQIRSDRNLAFAVAYNRVVAAGEAEIVVILNNDVNVEPDFLERLIAPFDLDPAIGSVGCLLLRPGAEVIDSAGLVADATLAGFGRHQGRLRAEADAGGMTLSGAAGAAAAFRRTAWSEVDGLDEEIPGYLEDLDLALRLRAAGWQITIALDAVAVHLGSQTFGHRSPLQRRSAGYARGYLMRRYRVLNSRAGTRAVLTEALVCAGDAVLSRDTIALRSRVAGWRAAATLPPRNAPPPDAVDQRLGFRRSLRLRLATYGIGS